MNNLENAQDIVTKIEKLINKEVETINGEASFGTLIKAFNEIDDEFNHAFSAGYGAKFVDDKLVNVDGFGLFKFLNYETHPILHVGNKMYLLTLTGGLMYDTYSMYLVRTDYTYSLDDIYKSKLYETINVKHNLDIREIVKDLLENKYMRDNVSYSESTVNNIKNSPYFARIEYNSNTVYLSVPELNTEYYKRIYNE